MLSLVKQNNPDAVVIKLLKNLKIDIASETIIAELDKHPDYPSLLAISDVLNNFAIENSAYRVEHNQLFNVPCPFIAHTHLNGGDFVLINKIEDDTVYLSSEKWEKHEMRPGELLKIYNGVVLTAEPGAARASSKTFSSFLTDIKLPLVITGLLLISISGLVFNAHYFNSYSWQIALLTLFKTAGLVTSVLLLVQSMDSNNPLVQKLCQSGSKTNCKTILSSKAAQVFEGLTWSEVGFFYFTGTWLVLLFGGHSIFLLQVLAILNIVSLPYTIYSIYYQARVAKQWCVLCCTVQALLWLEFIPSITYLNGHSLFYGSGAGDLSTLFICLLSPVILWLLLKPLFLKVQQLQPLKQQLRKFKYNTELFNNMLKEQPKYTSPDDSWSIVLGNVEANNCITMVTNPYCPPCSKTHKLLDELLSERGDIQARIVFTANNTDEDIKTPVSRHLMALNDLPDKKIVRKALHTTGMNKNKRATKPGQRFTRCI